MKLPNSKDLITNDVLMLWIIHEFSEAFREHALLKGGMQLLLLSSDRSTNDLDYVFTPFTSKKAVEPSIDAILSKVPGAKVEKSFHSNSGRYQIEVGRAQVQIEYNVAESVPSTTVTTQLLANRVGALPRVIRVMSSDVAFAHKLAAWNERRLIRDAYDCYYWYTNVGAMPSFQVLEVRLNNINSRLPYLKKTKKMPIEKFLDQLEESIEEMTERNFLDQLRPLMASEKIEGLFPIFRTKMKEMIGKLRALSK